MRKLFLTCLCIGFVFCSRAQEFPTDVADRQHTDNKGEGAGFVHHLSDPYYKMAIGDQYSFPVEAVSFKYAITNHSVLQAIASPIAFADGNIKYSFYGLRYNYRFPFQVLPSYGPFTVSYPYLFVGAGMLSMSYLDNSTKSDMSYFFGAGYELIMAKHFGFSAEIGYGTLTNVTALTYGGGFHYYFSCQRRMVSKEDEQENANPDEEQPPVIDNQPLDEMPTNKPRKHRSRDDE